LHTALHRSHPSLLFLIHQVTSGAQPMDVSVSNGASSNGAASSRASNSSPASGGAMGGVGGSLVMEDLLASLANDVPDMRQRAGVP